LRWEKIIKTVSRMTNLFKEFLLKVMSSQFKRLNVTVGKSSIVNRHFIAISAA